MDYRLFYTQRALSDLAETLGYIAEDDAASQFGTSLLDHLDLLSRFPCLGGAIRNLNMNICRNQQLSPLLIQTGKKGESGTHGKK